MSTSLRVPRSSAEATTSTPRSLPQAEWATWRRLVQVYQDRDTESAEIRARRGPMRPAPRQLTLDYTFVRRQSDAAPRRRPSARA